MENPENESQGEGSEADSEDSNDYYQQGKDLSESLVDEMESIDWEENYEKAEEAGKEAAEFLNGLLSGE